MSIARDRANRSGTDPLQIDNTKLVTDSGDLKVQDASGNEKKLIADEIHVGTGADKVILKRDSSTGKVAIQTQAAGEAAEGGTVASTTVYATTALLPTNPTDGQQALVTANNFMFIAKSNGWYKIAEITNTTPSVTSAGNATYQFLTDGTPVSIEITATDAEVGTALQYKYVVSSGSIGSSATVTSSATSGGTYSALAANTLTTNKFFKVTPSTNTAHAGTFSLTFSASDGVAVGTSSASEFTLQFQVAGSYIFDGTGDYISTPDSDDWYFGTGDFTLEAWIYSENISGNHPVISQWNVGGAAAANSWVIQTVGSNLNFYSVSGGTNMTSHTGTIALSTNKWYHVAIQRSSGTIKSYINGVEDFSVSNSTDFNNSSTALTIGAVSLGATPKYWDGYISNARIVKGSAVYTASDPGGASSASASYGMLSTPASLPSWGTTWTLETWIYITNSASYNTFFHNFGGSSSYIAKRGSKLEVYLMGGFSDSPGSGTFPLNEWVHIALSNNSGSLKNFINGVQVSSGTANTAPHSGGSGTLNMMAQGGNTWPTFGYMSDTRLVIGTSVYSGNFTPPTGPLTKTGGTYSSNTNVNTSFPAAHTYLLTNQTSSGTTIADNSDQNYTLVTAGALTGSTTRPYSATITAPTNGLTAVNNTKLLALTEAEPNNITNGSYYFAATDRKITSASSSDFTMGTSTDFTIEFWYKATTVNSSGYWFDIGSNTFVIQYFSSKTKIGIWNSSFTIQGPSNVGTSENVWHHCVAQRSGSTFQCFINGTSIGTNSTSHNLNQTTITLNNYGGGGSYGHVGYLSDFRVVKGTAVYSGNFTPPNGPLTLTGGSYPSNTNVNTSIPSGHTKLLTANHSSGAFDDDSNSNHTLTATGTVTPSAGIEGAPVDQSSSPHTLSLQGNTAHSYVSSFAQGSGGSALFGEYVGQNNTSIGTLIPTASSDFTLGTGDYCIDGWFKNTMPVNTSTTHNQRLFDLGDNGCRIFFKNGEIKAQTGSSTQMTYSPGADFGTNKWHHFALQRSSGTTKFFLGGVQRTSISDTQNHATTACKIGGYGGNDTDSYKFQGYISDFRVVKGATAHTITSASSYGGGSITFDGTGDYVTGVVTAAGTSDFTLEAWFNFDATGHKGIVHIGDNAWGTNANGIGFAIKPSISGYQIYYNDTYTNTSNQGSIPATGTWHHGAMVRTGGITKLYIDGVETISVSDSKNYASTHIMIGGFYNSSQVMDGKVSDVRYVVGTAVYTGAFTPPNGTLTTTGGTYLDTTNVNTSIPSGHTKLLTANEAGAINDDSASSVSLTAVADAAANAATPFVDTITLPTSKSTAITGTVLLTCQQSTGDFTDASASNHAISQGATGTVLATRHQPY
tara:strand:+ start:809 stop:4894 length:4086 start_codon:yes stop_codon:yes gene_type:complete